MRYFFVFILFSLFSEVTYAQNYDLPKNPEAGKCYQRCFAYDKPFEWKEVECNKIQDSSSLKSKYSPFFKSEKEKIKFRKYQEKLVSLGYDIDVTGLPDDRTINAHHRYLKLKTKEERVKARLERKAKRKNRKEKNEN